MLHTITQPNEYLLNLIKDDPVRPELTPEFRVNSNSKIFVLRDDATNEPLAVTCVKFLDGIPNNVDQLTELAVHTNTAVFYTIWSYAAGAGRTLIQEAQKSIESEFPGIQTYVTLSPKTEMARRFHIKNGARELRENLNTINYIYK